MDLVVDGTPPCGNNHNSSYLWHKIDSGGMPQGGFPMDPTVDVNPTVSGVQNAVDTIEDWINDCATAN
jgi:hypothetical protein